MKSKQLTLPGLSIAYKTWGDPKHPPILALHGWLDNCETFDWLAPYLERQFYVIAVDLPGHGLSSRLPQGCHYHFIDGIFTVVEIINALGYEKIHLLGHSMGACLASLVAGVVPNKIESLALIEGLGPFSSPDDSARSQLSNYLKHQVPDGTKPFKGYSSLDDAAKARAKRGHVSLKLAEKLCERGLEKKNELYYWRHDRRLLVPSPLRMTEGQVLSCLEAVNCKTCLIWAEDGFSFDSDLMKKRMLAIQKIKTHILKGGHHIHMEKPEEIAGLLLEFYSRS